MEDYKHIKSDLVELRRDIVSYINSQDEEQDLMDKFIRVKERDEATYELIMLIYQELKTTHKLNKKRLTHIIDKVIDVKIKTIDKLIEDRISMDVKKESSKSVPKQQTFGDKLWDAITFQNAVKAIGLWMVIFLFLFTMYTINSDAFNNAHDSIIETVKTTKEIK